MKKAPTSFTYSHCGNAPVELDASVVLHAADKNKGIGNMLLLRYYGRCYDDTSSHFSHEQSDHKASADVARLLTRLCENREPIAAVAATDENFRATLDYLERYGASNEPSLTTRRHFVRGLTAGALGMGIAGVGIGNGIGQFAQQRPLRGTATTMLSTIVGGGIAGQSKEQFATGRAYEHLVHSLDTMLRDHYRDAGIIVPAIDAPARS